MAGFDATTLKKKTEVPLKGHPESFQLDSAGSRMYVNVPGGFLGGGGMVVAADRETGKVTVTVELKEAGQNFPSWRWIAPVSRLYVGCPARPARLLALDTQTLAMVANAECVGDADDVFVDGARVYVIGGDGAVDVFESKSAALTRVASVKTESGARTGLLAPDRHLPYVAVPARSGHAAEVRGVSLEPAGRTARRKEQAMKWLTRGQPRHD